MVAIRQAFIPAGNANRPALWMNPTYITVHETANTAPGANAEMHRVFCWNGGGSEGVSFHWCVDDHEAVQLLPHNENGWHAGDGYYGTGNRESIAVETCVNSDGNWEQTLQNLAELIVYIIGETGISTERIVQHYHWSHKDCPHIMRIPPAQFNNVVANVRSLLAPHPVDDPITFPDNPFGDNIVVGGGFKNFLRRIPEDLWLPTFGYPETNEYQCDINGVVRTIQKFQRAIFSWYPEDLPDGVPPNNSFHIRVLLRTEQAVVP